MLQFIGQKTAIWVHTDMFAEYKAKKNYSQKIIFRAYQKADKMVLVHENLRANLIQNIKGISNKVTVVNHFLGAQRVKRLAEENLFETLQNVNVAYSYNDYQDSPDIGVTTVAFHEQFRISKVKMLNALFNPNIQVLINIGRYDYQKGHDKLIAAFEKVYLENPDVFLIMICPHGPLR